MSPEFPEDLREPPPRSSWWVGRGSGDQTRSRSVGQIVIGALGLASFTPFYDPGAETRGWDWLPYLSLAIWAGFVVVGASKLVKSFRS